MEKMPDFTMLKNPSKIPVSRLRLLLKTLIASRHLLTLRPPLPQPPLSQVVVVVVVVLFLSKNSAQPRMRH